MLSLPTGTITFLFTDIEDSTKLWETYPQDMFAALQEHNLLLQRIVKNHQGYVFKTVGDAFCAAFHTASEALSAAITAQRALHTHSWGPTGQLRVRMALHTGSAEERNRDYFGLTVNRVARLLATGHGD